MGYVVLKTIHLDGKDLAEGQKVPASVKWHGSSLRAAISRGLIALDTSVPGAEAPEKAAKSGPDTVSGQCQSCGKRFKNARGLSLHARTHARG